MNHTHHHGSDHGHGHSHAARLGDLNRTFAIGVALNVTYVVVEAGFGFWANSLALLSDAGHNLSDVLGLLLAWGASYLAKRPPRGRYTFGLRSSTILAALLNGLLLLVACGGIVWEAIRRLWLPTPVPGMTIIVVAAIGVVINTCTALLFLSGRKSDLNVRGAFLHMAADAAVSLGVVLAGVAIMSTQRQWIDPAVSLVVAAVILWSTWGLLRESTDLILQAVPRSIDREAVAEYLLSVPGVTDIHDLHIWAMSTTETALTAHLIRPEVENDDEFLASVNRELHDRFDIAHATIQIERSSVEAWCRQADEHAV